MASLLWTKPEKRSPTMYAELFSNVPTKLQMEFIRWDQQLRNSAWQHRFLHYQNEPIKSEMTAKRFGIMGDEYFKCKEWRKAMEMYNQAMCFAENDSEYLSILYAKRGFCFSNMKMCNAGIADIHFAKNGKLPTEWVTECQTNIEMFNHQSKQRTPLLPQLSFECADDYPSMANVLELKVDENNRTYIVAKVDIDVGQTVLVEHSFVSVANGYNKTCCETCLNEMRNFMPCRTCTDVVFCSIDCFQRNQIHRKFCGENFHRMPASVKFVIHSILHAISICPSIDFLMQFVELHMKLPRSAAATATFKSPLDAKLRDYGLFLKQSHQNTLPTIIVYQVYTTLLSMPSITNLFNTRAKQRFMMHLVGHHTMILACNAFGGFETDQNQFISGTMANLVALISHSCTPNTVHFAHGNREVVIILRPIRAGERLCYDYWPHSDIDDGDGEDDQSMGKRKQLLWQNWRIDCKCRKCRMKVTSNPLMTGDPAFFFVSKYKRYFDNNAPKPALLKQKCIQFLRKFKDEAWANETEIVAKTYSQCILDEYNNGYCQT